MSLYDGSIVSPQSYEVVEAIRALVIADAYIISHEGVVSAAMVFEHAANLRSTTARHIVIRERIDLGGQMQTISGRQLVYVQLMAVSPLSKRNHHQWLGAIHKRAELAIVGQKPTLVLGTLELPFAREQRPSPAAYDEEKEEWYSTALYSAVLKSIG